MLNGMALFAGIGGIELGLKEYVRTVCYVEIDSYCQAVIRSRISEGQLDDAPIWDDIKAFNGKPWRGAVDIITGGFPCQDISVAGKGKGIKKDTRSGLWFEMLRIIDEVQPSFVFVENVSALTNRGMDVVLGCLSQAGYDARWTDLRASDVGASHRRERIFILAYPKRGGYEGRLNVERQEGCERRQWSRTFDKLATDGKEKDVADTQCKGLHKGNIPEKGQVARYSAWNTDPAELNPSSKSYVGRVVDEISHRVDRIKCLGNAVVPLQAKTAFEILMCIDGKECL